MFLTDSYNMDWNNLSTEEWLQVTRPKCKAIRKNNENGEVTIKSTKLSKHLTIIIKTLSKHWTPKLLRQKLL